MGMIGTLMTLIEQMKADKFESLSKGDRTQQKGIKKHCKGNAILLHRCCTNHNFATLKIYNNISIAPFCLVTLPLQIAVRDNYLGIITLLKIKHRVDLNNKVIFVNR